MAIRRKFPLGRVTIISRLENEIHRQLLDLARFERRLKIFQSNHWYPGSLPQVIEVLKTKIAYDRKQLTYHINVISGAQEPEEHTYEDISDRSSDGDISRDIPALDEEETTTEEEL